MGMAFDLQGLHGGRNSGLTLIELMITLAILSLTLALTAPSLQQLLRGNQIRTEASRLLGAINLARSEAVLRNVPVSVCPSAMATSGVAQCSQRYTDGWIVFSNSNRDRQVDAGTDDIIRAYPGVPRGLTLTNRSGTRSASELITYLPDGSSRRNLTLLLCGAHYHRVSPWQVILNRVGRARLSARGGSCPVASV
tara:strand:- start:1053 stop:1637 length:585 start_codon:yes stop_codon:yes gene_type:complete